jgi:hypothetical protein
MKRKPNAYDNSNIKTISKALQSYQLSHRLLIINPANNKNQSIKSTNQLNKRLIIRRKGKGKSKRNNNKSKYKIRIMDLSFVMFMKRGSISIGLRTVLLT